MAADGPELSVVIPVYNEEGAIGAVLDEWAAVLDSAGIDYELRVYDDGSRDRSREAIEAGAVRHPRIIPLHHANRGHGPTVMRGYTESRGAWIFQTDSDGEMPAAAFPQFWQLRSDHDFILGRRSGRISSVSRKVLSGGARMVTRLLFGAKLRDINVPYRLMRGSWLREQLPLLDQTSAVPNVVLSGLAARTGARVAEVPVPHTNRRTGATSLNLRRIGKLSLRAVVDSIRVAASHPHE